MHMSALQSWLLTRESTVFLIWPAVAPETTKYTQRANARYQRDVIKSASLFSWHHHLFEDVAHNTFPMVVDQNLSPFLSCFVNLGETTWNKLVLSLFWKLPGKTDRCFSRVASAFIISRGAHFTMSTLAACSKSSYTDMMIKNWKTKIRSFAKIKTTWKLRYETVLSHFFRILNTSCSIL